MTEEIDKEQVKEDLEFLTKQLSEINSAVVKAYTRIKEIYDSIK